MCVLEWLLFGWYSWHGRWVTCSGLYSRLSSQQPPWYGQLSWGFCPHCRPGWHWIDSKLISSLTEHTQLLLSSGSQVNKGSDCQGSIAVYCMDLRWDFSPTAEFGQTYKNRGWVRRWVWFFFRHSFFSPLFSCNRWLRGYFKWLRGWNPFLYSERVIRSAHCTIWSTLGVWGEGVVWMLASAHVLHQPTTPCPSISHEAEVWLMDRELSEARVIVPRGEHRVMV